MKIIKNRSTEVIKEFNLVFHYINEPDLKGSGFCFDCDDKGNVDVTKLQPAAAKNYAACLIGETKIIINKKYQKSKEDSDGDEYIPGTGKEKIVKISSGEIVDYSRNYISPAIGECSCRERVALTGFTNTCDNCGSDYNMSGQLLADRSQWGIETGENINDILRGGDLFDSDY